MGGYDITLSVERKRHQVEVEVMIPHFMFLDVAAHNSRALKVYERLRFRHLEPVWRLESKDLPVFREERYATIRDCFRRRGRAIECKFYDMVLTREEYLEQMRTAHQGDGQPEKGKGDAGTVLFRKQR